MFLLCIGLANDYLTDQQPTVYSMTRGQQAACKNFIGPQEGRPPESSPQGESVLQKRKNANLRYSVKKADASLDEPGAHRIDAASDRHKLLQLHMLELDSEENWSTIPAGKKVA